MVRVAFVVSILSIGLARDPGCGGADSPLSGVNAPCTRSRDCGGDLQCFQGVCSAPDSGVVPVDAGVDAAPEDAGNDDGG